MACGSPVITTQAGALPEVAGGAAVLVPPKDDAALAEALRRVCAEGALRLRLREAGVARAAQFTWSAAAADTLDVYRAVLSRPA